MPSTESSLIISLREDVDLQIQKGGISVFVSGDFVGELSVADEQILPLQALIGMPFRSAPINELSRMFTGKMIEPNPVGSLVQNLLNAGLAIQYVCSISPEKALRIARWTSHVDRVITILRDSKVHLIGKNEALGALAPSLKNWGICTESVNYEDWNSRLWERSSLVISSERNSDNLKHICKTCNAHNIPVLPVQGFDEGWRVGPIFVAGVSACPFCEPLDRSQFFAGSGRSTRNCFAQMNGWDFVAECIVELLACRPGSLAPFEQHLISFQAEILGNQTIHRAPRCSVCSRLNQYPENAVIYG